jgi:hypothetical protein
MKRETGNRDVGRWEDGDRRTDATQSRHYSMQSERRRKKGGRKVGGPAKPLLESP